MNGNYRCGCTHVRDHVRRVQESQGAVGFRYRDGSPVNSGTRAFMVIYMRGLEIKPDQGKGRAQSSRELSQVYEMAQAAAKEVGGAPNNKHPGGREWKTPPRSRCYLCSKENLDGARKTWTERAGVRIAIDRSPRTARQYMVDWRKGDEMRTTSSCFTTSFCW